MLENISLEDRSRQILNKVCGTVWTLAKSNVINDGSYWIDIPGNVFSVENHEPSASRLLNNVGRNNLRDVSRSLNPQEGDDTVVILIGGFIAVKVVANVSFLATTFPEDVSEAQIASLKRFVFNEHKIKGEKICVNGDRPGIEGLEAILRTMRGLTPGLEVVEVKRNWKGDGD